MCPAPVGLLGLNAKHRYASRSAVAGLGLRNVHRPFRLVRKPNIELQFESSYIRIVCTIWSSQRMLDLGPNGLVGAQGRDRSEQSSGHQNAAKDNNFPSH
jgi:hypothetical protein